MSSELQFAIIGCGKISPRHAAEAATQGKLVAVCDILPDRVNTLAKQFGANAYYDINDLFKAEKKIDIVAVCTPNGLHADHSITAMAAGSHVLCEKPLSITVADAGKMIDAARHHDKKLFVVKSARFNPALVELRELLAQGAMGRVYSFQMNCFWNRPADYYKGSWRGGTLDGGTLFTQFSHYLDAILWLWGDVGKISGFRKNISHQGIIQSEDSGIISMEMASGILGGLNWSVNSFKKNMEVSLTVLAEKGSIRIGGEYMHRIDYQVTGGNGLSTAVAGSSNDYGTYAGSMSHHDKVYENLVKALMDDGHPFTQAAEGLKTVELIERIYNSVSLS